MKRLLILSGKGGTGKTTTAAAFIGFSGAKAFADCDVDAPNLHLVSSFDSVGHKTVYMGSKKASINTDLCAGCGKCLEVCRFDSVEANDGKYKIKEFACEGCAVCTHVCPQQAISMVPDEAGEMELYKDYRVFSTARLKMGRGNSGKLVTEVKAALKREAQDSELQIIDGSPGIGCPVIASVAGVDMALIVTEPSVSGISDLKRLVKTAGSLEVKIAVCVNKFDISFEKTKEIMNFCKDLSIPFVGCVPFDRKASEAINSGKSIAYFDCPARNALFEIYKNTIEILNN
ncbi:MAG: ATPase [Ruminococcaceae bacterium]|nr:ATPase [Oscillospiraceae bacterium]